MPIDNLSKITSRSGINTTILLEAGNANVTGIVTAAGFVGPFTGGGDIAAGIITGTGLKISGISTLNGAVYINRTSALGNSKLSITKDASQEGIGVQLSVSSGITTSLTTFNSSGTQIFDLAHDTDGTPDLIFKLKHPSVGFPVERVRIASNGNVGISSNNSTPEALLDIKNVGTSVLPFKAYRNDVGDTPIMHLLAYNNTLGVVDKLVVTSRGRVGVNTDDPQREIHIKPDSSTASAAPAYVRIESHGSDQSAELELYHTRGNGSDKWPSAVASADGALTLKVANGNNGAPAEKVRITSDGKVGINSTSPSNTLVVQESTDNNSSIQLFRASTGGDIASINWATNQGNQAKINYRGATPSGMQFYTGGGADSNLRMLIDPDGKVGIGTNEPDKLLELFGTDPTIKLRDSSGDAYALIEGDSADGGSIRFRADPLSAGSNSHIRFDTDGTEKVRIPPDDGTQLTRGPQGGRAHTGNTSNWMKIGTWNKIEQQGRLKITVFGVATYDSNANVAGETVIYISSNANYTLKGYFHSIVHGISKRNGIQKVALKYDSSTTPTSCEVWVKYNGSYSQTFHLADASIGYWVGADVNTGSTSTPAGAEEIFSSYSIATSDGNQSDVRVAISSEGKIGIGTHDPQAPVHIDGGTTGTQRLRVQNHASVGAFSGNYGSEFRHATSSANHCMLIHCQEANDDRRTLDISDANGVFAQFTNGKFGVGTAGNDAGHPTRDVEICSPTGGILRISSSDDSLGANEKLGTVEFHTDDDDGGHIGAAITAIADPSDAFGRRTALLFGTQSDEATDAVERLRITASGIVANAGFSTSFGRIQRTYGPGFVSGTGGSNTRDITTGAVGKKIGGGTLVINAFRTSDPTKCTTVYYDFQLRGYGTNGNRSNERQVAHNGGVNYSIGDISEGFRFTNNESFTVTMTATFDLTGEL